MARCYPVTGCSGIRNCAEASSHANGIVVVAAAAGNAVVKLLFLNMCLLVVGDVFSFAVVYL